MIEYRALQSVEELEQVVDLEILVWGLDPRDAVPINIMRPLAMHGGMVGGAFLDGRLVGMSLAFPVRAGRQWILWSHMAAVHPHHQGHGIGFGLKQAQRTWALQQGYTEMRWTFDPLQRGNANFNLHMLGATIADYHDNHYGQMRDAINQHAESDRVEARWKLRDRRVTALAKQPAPQAPLDLNATFALRAASDGSPQVAPLPHDSEQVCVQIPASLTGLSSDQVRAWRLAVRHVLSDAFALGCTGVDFCESESMCAYVLRAPPPWYLYVLRCSDDSLYTGVSPDVAARLNTHQRGRGAAYTKVRRPVQLVGAWKFTDRSNALKAELAFKDLARSAKLTHIQQRRAFRDAPFVELVP